jgi:hypothetical protein
MSSDNPQMREPDDELSRREFLHRAAAGGVVVAGGMPRWMQTVCHVGRGTAGAYLPRTLNASK